MAIESTFINASGPFLGTSCLRWRWNDGQAMRSPVSINVDTSRGTIRPREGFSTIKRYTNTFKVLGVRGFTTTNATPLIAVLLWDEANQKTLFNVIAMDGTQVSTTSVDMGVIPLGHPPSPHGYPSFESFSSATGNALWITTPHGRIHEYSFDADRTKPRLVRVDRDWPFSNDKDGVPYLEMLPRAQIVHSIAGFTVYAGLDSAQWITSTIRIPGDQTLISEGFIGNSREAVRYPKNVFLLSNPAEPTNVKAYWYFDVGAGEEITGLTSLNSRLLVFTKSSVFIADLGDPGGDPPVTQIGPLIRGVGCVGHRTISQGRGMVAWMGYDGFHMWDGGQVRKISDDIEDMFLPTGWAPGPLYGFGRYLLERFPWPIRISKAQLNQACGTFDEERQCFWWSVPVDGADDDDIEKPAKVCLLYYPGMQSWSIYINTGGSTLSPTCMHSFFDGTEHKMIFGDQWGGINVFGGEPSDVGKTSSGGRSDTKGSVHWIWQSPPMQLDPNMSFAARSLRVTMNAIGVPFSVGTAPQWYLETERSFDQTDGQMSFTGDLGASPSADPPQSTNKDHYWSIGTWGSFKWHGPGIWRSKHSIPGAAVGEHFIVGFSGAAGGSTARQTEIHSFSIEVQPRRDIT